MPVLQRAPRRIEWGVPADLPGVGTLRVRNDEQLWRVFHDTYTVCNGGFLKPGTGAEWTYRGRLHSGGRGAIQLFEPGELHATVRETGPVDFDVLFIAPARLRESARRLDCGGRQPHFAKAFIKDPRLDRELRGLMASLSPEATTLERQTRLTRVLGRLLYEQTEHAPPLPRRAREPRAMARVRAFLHDHMAVNVTLDELAAVAGLNPFWLVRAFEQEVGLPPHQYQLAVRVATGARLLARGMLLGEAAAILGFADQSHFARHFRRIQGVPPGEFQQAISPSARRQDGRP